MKNKLLTWFGVIGLVVILAGTAAIVAGMAFNSVKNVSSTEAFITAFGGAFFAYVFVKLGELFTRLSKREKLNKDTIVEIQYILNDHLNRIDLNIRTADALIKVINAKASAVNLIKFKPIPIDKSNLRNMKNLDFINDLFNYYVDLEKINDSLDLILTFARNAINGLPTGSMSFTQHFTVQQSYTANSTAILEQIKSVKKFLKTAEKDCVELMGKSEYVIQHRNVWLSPAVPWFNSTHYDKKKLKMELPDLIAKFEKSRDDNTAESIEKIKKTLASKP